MIGGTLIIAAFVLILHPYEQYLDNIFAGVSEILMTAIYVTTLFLISDDPD